MNMIAGPATTVVEEVTTRVGNGEGEEFAAYVRATLFPEEEYCLLAETHDHAPGDDDYVEGTKEPDLKLRSLSTGEVFFVEPEYRSAFHNDTIEWCEEGQFNRYREIDALITVYLALGVGAQPGHPDEAYLVPVSHIKYRKLYSPFLRRYGIDPKRHVDPESLRPALNEARDSYCSRPPFRLLTLQRSPSAVPRPYTRLSTMPVRGRRRRA